MSCIRGFLHARQVDPPGSAETVDPAGLTESTLVRSTIERERGRVGGGAHRGHVALEVALIGGALAAQHAGVLAVGRHRVSELRAARTCTHAPSRHHLQHHKNQKERGLLETCIPGNALAGSGQRSRS